MSPTPQGASVLLCKLVFTVKMVLYSKGDAGRTLVPSLPTNGATEFTVPDGTAALADHAFEQHRPCAVSSRPEGPTTIG